MLLPILPVVTGGAFHICRTTRPPVAPHAGVAGGLCVEAASTVSPVKMTGSYRPAADTMAPADEVTVEGDDYDALLLQLRERTPAGQVLLSVRMER